MQTVPFACRAYRQNAQERSPTLCLHEHEQQAMQYFRWNYGTVLKTNVQFCQQEELTTRRMNQWTLKKNRTIIPKKFCWR